ncbi:hypothetical protein G3576_21485 [Roseomonas stagni]|uniref:Uncharacterized protein n=1 Tax=Falsiroseomonas algicola TaxID=2716930 RepID=A0A6M1LQC7_9PROT|nr:hypothetical protein [Falsiroseomonas algicola]NGM22601.1 hypothetical protein [Falsiroseomonas algicola]
MASSASAKRGAKPRGKASGRGGAGRWDWVQRWWKVALLVTLVTIGLPVAHALFGEVVALLGGAVLFGFLLGRWTAPR